MMMLPRLPLQGEPDGHVIEFRSTGMGTMSAMVFNDEGLLVDAVRGHTLRDAYDRAREVYPQASWEPSWPDNDEEEA